MKNVAYQVMHIESYVTTLVLGRAVDVPLTWADGMLGVSPIFATLNQAEAYANGHDVVEIKQEALEDDTNA